jgi:hypothetical protein
MMPLSYTFTPDIDKAIRVQMMTCAHTWLYVRRHTREDAVELLKMWLSVIICSKHSNKSWRGNPEAERAVREAPENQGWMLSTINEAIEGADATQAAIEKFNG